VSRGGLRYDQPLAWELEEEQEAAAAAEAEEEEEEEEAEAEAEAAAEVAAGRSAAVAEEVREIRYVPRAPTYHRPARLARSNAGSKARGSAAAAAAPASLCAEASAFAALHEATDSI